MLMTVRLMTTVGVDKGYTINCVRREKKPQKKRKKLKHSLPPYIIVTLLRKLSAYVLREF